MSKELAALLLAANLSLLGGAVTASSAAANQPVATVQTVDKPGSYEVLSWDAIGGGRHPQGVVQDRATDC